MKKRTIYITLFLIFIIGLVSLIGTFAIDSSITEGNSTKADYLFNITLGDRTNRDILIPGYDSKIVDIKISNPNEFNMAYLLYLEGVNSNLSIINISNNEASGVLNSKTNTLIKVFIQNNSSSDITTSIKDIVGFESEKLSVPSNNTSINKGTYYKVIVKSNDNTYGKVKPNIKLSTSGGTVKYTLVPNTGYQYKSTTCNGAVSNNILTISNITSNTTCEVVFEPKQITVNFDLAGGGVEIAVYTELKEHTYITPYTGTYKLETWGAQGGNFGGYGAYSAGIVSLNSGDILYANVGGSGSGVTGGYNGGGTALAGGYGGGGATHIASESGLLSTFSSKLSSILIIAGGGGGNGAAGAGGNGGGINGGSGVDGACSSKAGGGATQTSGGSCVDGYWCNNGSFGIGGAGKGGNNGGAGGGGLYGGGAGTGGDCYGGGGGGSGYIGNSLLTDKYMYCYNCSTSDATDTKTYTTTCHSDSLTANCVKEGNGATRITLLSNFSHTKTYNTKYSDLPTPTRSGYTFDGWYTGENGTGTKVTNDTVLKNANTHTLYAKWVIKNVKVNFDLAGGVVETTYTEPKEHTYTVLYNGTYKLETWGAQGGGVSSLPGGYGGYSAGNIELSQNEKLYVYVGENYNGYKSTLSFNGGGSGTYSTGENTVNFNGGGATDIRLVSGDWNSTASLASRIIIAGGGGGYSNWSTGSKGGSAGGLIGYPGNRVGSIVNSTGGTQVSGGYGTENRTDIPIMGAFGIGGYSGLYSSEWIYNSGGGGGYYGGGAGGAISGSVGSASGGSSYISGHTGCVAIISQNDITPKAGCTTGTTDNSCSIHYSGKKFTNTVMIDGQGYSWTNTKGALQRMPNPSGGYYASGNGNSGNGAARITLVDNANYKVTYNTKYSDLPTPTRSGYTFDGWYTGENGTGTKVTNDTVLTNENNHTLYAKWRINNVTATYDGNIFTPSINYKVDNGLTITYDPNTSYLTINGTPTTSGQSLGIMYNLSFTEGEKYASKVTYISGSFNNTGSDGGCFALDVKNSNGVEVSTRNYADLQFTTSSAETILTINSAGASEGDRFQYWLWFNTPADWTFTNYTVKLDLSKIESKTIQHGQKYGTMPTPIRTGYTFEGWYTGENGTGTRITSDTLLTNKDNHTLYAKWTVNSYYLDLNGMLNGSSSGGISGYGTADVYINGILVCNDCADYYSEHPYGTAYSISDIKTTAGHTYNGVYSGSASGTITGTTAVYLNFSTSDTTPPTCSLSASGSNITASASDNVGLSYQGWDSSYSGTSITSKDIASGTHTYYVKDTAGNTNTCSISISGLVEKDIPYTETSAAYANYTTVYSGSCRCSKKVTGGTSYVEGYCNPSSGCSCPGGTSISSNSCIGTKKITGYYCPGNGTVSGSTCIYTKYKITRVCPDGYSGVSGNSNFCYKY